MGVPVQDANVAAQVLARAMVAKAMIATAQGPYARTRQHIHAEEQVRAPVVAQLALPLLLL
jgi:hypothetical protein